MSTTTPDPPPEAPRCPKCDGAPLWPLRGEKAPGGEHRTLRCETCHGLWLRRPPQDELPPPPEDDAPATHRPGEVDPDSRTGVCPDGHAILIRAEVETEAPFYLERCRTCGGVWFDAGEWKRLAQSHLIQHLGDLWSPSLRRARIEARTQASLDEALRHLVGDEAFGRLTTLAGELAEHPHRAAVLAWLRSRWGGS